MTGFNAAMRGIAALTERVLLRKTADDPIIREPCDDELDYYLTVDIHRLYEAMRDERRRAANSTLTTF